MSRTASRTADDVGLDGEIVTDAAMRAAMPRLRPDHTDSDLSAPLSEPGVRRGLAGLG